MQHDIHDAPPNPSTTGDDNRPAHPPHAPVCCQSSIDMMPERATEMFQSRSSITSADRVSGSTPGPLMREYTTVYALTADGVNRFSALVQPGFDDDHNRTSDAECQRIAALMQAAPDLLAALRIAEAALADIGDADREAGDDVPRCERRAAQALSAARAAIARATTP